MTKKRKQHKYPVGTEVWWEDTEGEGVGTGKYKVTRIYSPTVVQLDDEIDVFTNELDIAPKGENE